jgi:cyanophycin synthetase
VLIQRNGNVALDVTDIVHPSVAAAATLVARVVGLDIAGVDLVLQDVSRPLTEQRGAVIEVNASPGLLAHLKPAGGVARPVGKAIIDHLFGPHQTGRIPIVGITGTQNTARIARLIAWLVHISGKQVGLACEDGFFLNARQVQARDCRPWQAAQRLLINPAVEVAVFEHSSQGILSEGLPYDKCLVGLVTDVSGFESLQEFFINDLDKLYNVLRTQVDVILPQGTAVLNAADAQVVEMADLCDGEVIFYGLNPENEAIARHRNAGKRVVFVQNDHIVLAQGPDSVTQIALKSLPASKANKPEMVMAAVAVAWALEIAPELIGAGLRTFESTSPLKN